MPNTTRDEPLFSNKDTNITPLFTPEEKNKYFIKNINNKNKQYK